MNDYPRAYRAFYFNFLAKLTIAGLATVPAWFFGGVSARSQQWFLAILVAGVCCWAVAEFQQSRLRCFFPITVVPLIVGLALVSFQLVPIPATVRQSLSPTSEQWRVPNELPPDAFVNTQAVVESATEFSQHGNEHFSPLTLYPASTRRELFLLASCLAAFSLSASLFRTRREFLWLSSVVAINGGALALFGLAQKASWNGQIYWRYRIADGVPFASFVNRNNAAGYLLLCLACGLGMIFWVGTHHREQDRGDEFGRRQEHTRSRRFRHALLGSVARLDGRIVGAILLVAVIIGGILGSLSRGGALALVGAALVVVAVPFFIYRRMAHAAGLMLGVASALLLVGWLGMASAVRTRAATLFGADIWNEARLSHWREVSPAIPDFWLTGSGIGTYRFIYRPYQRGASPLWFYHAENQYLEAFIEGGIGAVVLILAALFLAVVGAWLLIRERSEVRSVAAGVVLLFAVASQAIQACFDFGLWIPANHLLFAILCGAASGVALERARSGAKTKWFVLSSRPTTTAILTVALLGFLLLGWRDLSSKAGVQNAMKANAFDADAGTISSRQLEGAIRELSAAVERRPDDAEGHRRLAHLHRALFRMGLVERMQEENATERIGSDVYWPLTAPELLYVQFQQMQRAGDEESLRRWRDDPLVQSHLSAAARHLTRSQRACPLFADIDLDLAELSPLFGQDTFGEAHIQRAMELAPSSDNLRFRCGFLDLYAGRRARAAANWRRFLELRPSAAAKILDLASSQFTMEEIINEILPSSPSVLLELADTLYASDIYTFQRALLIQHAEQLLEESRVPDADQKYLEGLAKELRGQYNRAVNDYQTAVKLRPERVSWRLRLAKLYQHQGLLEEARAEARRCVRLDPAHVGAHDLLNKLIHEQMLRVPAP